MQRIHLAEKSMDNIAAAQASIGFCKLQMTKGNPDAAPTLIRGIIPLASGTVRGRSLTVSQATKSTSSLQRQADGRRKAKP
jgi:hypothetical protein